MIINSEEQAPTTALSQLSTHNPFTPRRIELEREVLGSRFVWTDAAWHKRQDVEGVPPNIDTLTEVAGEWSERIRERLLNGAASTPAERKVYRDIVHYYIYNTYEKTFHEFLEEEAGTSARCHAPFYKGFHERLEYYFAIATPDLWETMQPEHLFACFYQLRRAFHFIHGNILGASMTSARLRASVWESIFTHDMRRYRRSLFKKMTDISTLITGPSGTGKDLVAQAIGYSRYIPFSGKTQHFDEDYRATFYPVNISALSKTLIESELFGHRKGSFTGAIDDRIGWFGLCTERGTVFLDEIGETDPDIQVKLLRVLQSREFQRVGDVSPSMFRGKIIAATNRNLVEAIKRGAFREDLYYRLCADVIETPSLSTQIAEAPGELQHYLLYIARRVAGAEEAEPLAKEAEAYIHKHIGDDYAWPGNVRELEQCVRNILIRQQYTPRALSSDNAPTDLGGQLMQGTLTMDEVTRRYVSLVYARCKNYEETGRLLGLDGRTVKAKVDSDFVALYDQK